jgi:N-acetylmuramoyl-L-alanine amidase
MAIVVLDAGHGGPNPGAIYDDRKESEDALNLVIAIGPILEANGIDVVYTRTDDVFETPFQKAQEGNAAGADYFVSIHRNSSVKPEQYSGIESLVYAKGLRSQKLAENINRELEQVGFINLGISERPNLAVLRRTKMPAVLVEVGFINTARDNELLDTRFYEVANAIAQGMIETVY